MPLVLRRLPWDFGSASFWATHEARLALVKIQSPPPPPPDRLKCQSFDLDKDTRDRYKNTELVLRGLRGLYTAVSANEAIAPSPRPLKDAGCRSTGTSVRVVCAIHGPRQLVRLQPTLFACKVNLVTSEGRLWLGVPVCRHSQQQMTLASMLLLAFLCFGRVLRPSDSPGRPC